MEDADGNELEVANRPQSIVRLKVNEEVEPDTFMRMQRKK